MKTIAIGSFFVLFAIVTGAVSSTAYAEPVMVSTPQGTSVPGCEETNECFMPYMVTVDVGGEVTWSNDDSAAHTVTAGSAADGPSGVFDSSLFMAGTTFSHTFESAGEFSYFCMVHPWMEGIVTVGEAMMDGDKNGIPEELYDDPEEHDEKDATRTGMLSDGTPVYFWTTQPTAGEIMQIAIEIEDSEHTNHHIIVTQNGEEVMNDVLAHSHDGHTLHKTAELSSSDPVDITFTFDGFGIKDRKTGPVGEELVYTNVVPEFGTVAMMILAVSIISIVAVTAKTRVIPRL
jgi:predicted secreted protein with PEFG-CTERM motif